MFTIQPTSTSHMVSNISCPGEKHLVHSCFRKLKSVCPDIHGARHLNSALTDSVVTMMEVSKWLGNGLDGVREAVVQERYTRQSGRVWHGQCLSIGVGVLVGKVNLFQLIAFLHQLLILFLQIHL